MWYVESSFSSGKYQTDGVQDGLLAARILASMFKQDDVPYRIVPVGGYAELETKRDEVLQSEEVSWKIAPSPEAHLAIASYPDLAVSWLPTPPLILFYLASRMSATHYRLA